MAVRGLNFAVLLRRSWCPPPVRFLRTKKEFDFDDAEDNSGFEGAYASNEKIESTRFGNIRRDKQNTPHRHGEFEPTNNGKLLLGFDIPLPEEAVNDAKQGKEKTKTPVSERKKVGKTKKGRDEAKNSDIKIRTVKKGHELSGNTENFEEEKINSAFDAVKAELRKKDEPPVSSKFDSFGFRILRAEIKPQIWTMPKEEVLKCLLRNILFDSPELFILDKPYGLSMHEGGDLDVGDKMALTSYLDDMAKSFKVKKLYPVHRLDKDVTGVLCIAKNNDIASTVKAMFKARQIKKEYVAITRGVPPEKEGIIDSAIAEGTLEGRRRMVIVPTAVPGSNISVPKFERKFLAVTRYKIISATKQTAFVRLLPETGYKHQLRVHLGLGLRCPILGDHKYSSLRTMTPQKLPGEMLDRLKVRQEKVREIPIHLHSRHIVIPGILREGRDVIVKSAVPTHFKRNLERLHLEY